MENTVLSRVDQPKVSAVSGIGTFVVVFFLVVGAHFCPWLARGVRRAARCATAQPSDRPLGPPQPVSPWLLDHPATAGVCSFS